MKIRNSDGVSVIIATILMVAVTVVLAGVLYVMIVGIGGGSTDDMAPLGSWNSSNPVNSTSASMVFGDFTTEVSVIDLKIYLYEGNGANFTTIIIPTPLTAQQTSCVVGGHNASAIDAVYSDYGWTSNHINAGDTLTITGLNPGSYYTIKVFHEPSQSIVSMTGATSGFQLPP